MKKLINLTLSLTLLAGLTFGCSEPEDDDDSMTSKGSSSSAYSEEDTTEDVTEEDTTEPASTALTTTAAETTAVTTTVTNAPSVEPSTGDYPGAPDINFVPSTPIPVTGGDVVGYWEVEKLFIDGQELTETLGVPVNVLMQFEIKSNGTLELTSFDEVEYGKWTQNGNIVTIDIDDEALDFELKDERLVAEEDGTVIYLMKVEKFSEYDYSDLFDY